MGFGVFKIAGDVHVSAPVCELKFFKSPPFQGEVCGVSQSTALRRKPSKPLTSGAVEGVKNLN
jgi:hypothetical protein